ncbi:MULTISPECIES: cell wall metabolism sensor histidine kinase WalK [unclassified Fusibacter]|uniref:sensor histidine kinase n=1 Tax=unclassified Fusibacter TaxID=2624464 RepID=UPI00101370C1|nr:MULTISPECIES: HAMP domain-containing sensor histidine kinase [unclassified Fusibacter]MCK8060176.1 HAMP domain-containing histidine kinase [Fusibacter sp. A2]NPE22316.1 HAMP domain-containing histidine kinase [Fusibacter sp. A1]RXV61089.1 sensor histidine kinase [Fusibacter sp. A1]
MRVKNERKIPLKSNFGIKLLLGWILSLFIPIVVLFFVTFAHYGDGIFKIFTGDIDIWQMRGYMTTEQIARDINIWSLDSPIYQEHDQLNELLSSYMRQKNPFYMFFVERKGDQFAPFLPLSAEIQEDIETKFAGINADSLPGFMERNILTNELLLEKTGYVMYKQLDFYYEDGEEGSIYFFLKYTDLPAALMTFIRENLIRIIFTLLILHAVMSFIFIKRMTKPINEILDTVGSYSDHDFKPRLSEEVKEPIFMLINSAINDMAGSLQANQENEIKIEEMRKEFLAQITHDTKTPLASIRAHAEAIRDNLLDTDEKRTKYGDNILKKVHSIDNMINELSLYSDLEIGIDQYAFSKVDLDYYLLDILEELTFDYSKEQLDIEYMRPMVKRIYVNLDVERFNRVVVNVIKNSVKYSGRERTHVAVSIERVGDRVRMMFRDNGFGSDEPEIGSLFKSFKRGDKSRNPNQGGSGLGLAIAQSIVLKHQGSIWAESEYGKYFMIAIELPIEGDTSEENINH